MNQLFCMNEPSRWFKSRMGNVFRIYCLLFFLVVMQGHSFHASAQRVTLKIEGGLEKVLNELTARTGYGFVGDSELLNRAGTIAVHVENEDLDKVLAKIFAQVNMTYTMQDRMVTYKAVPKNQQQVITGTVRTPEGAALPGASVRVKGSPITTSTDVQGNFILTNVPQNARIEVSYIGHHTQEAVATANMQVVLQPMSQMLQMAEVTVGYGKVQRKDLTGSISSLSEKDLEFMPYATVDNALMGRVSGVHVTKADGQPGGALRVQIRGTASITGDNEPLYVVDGVPIMPESPYISNSKNSISGGEVAGGFERGISPISGLNIDDIQSIDVLKDASASAIYGSRAANGVVIITTKSGVRSRKPIFSLDAYTGVRVAARPQVLSSEQFKEITREAARNNPTHSVSQQVLDTLQDYFGMHSTDWIDEVTRNAKNQNLHLGVRGGTESTLYYTSLSITDQNGTEIGSDFKRVAGKTNIDYSISPRFKLGTNLNYNHSVSNVSMGLSRVAYQFRPDYPIRNVDGSYFTSPDRATVNPVALSTATNRGKSYGFIGTGFVELGLYEGLTLKSSLTYGMTHYHQQQYTPRYIRVSNENPNTNGTGARGYRSSNYSIWENTLSYFKNWNEHHLNAVAGMSFQENKMDYDLAVGSGYPDDVILNNLSSAALAYDVQGYSTGNGLASYFMRGNYDYQKKYLVTFTARMDGSSKFSDNYQYGFFPSAAVAWRVSSEQFMQSLTFINDLKLRYSLGKTGKQNIGDYLWRGLYESTRYANIGGSFPSTIKNDNVRWEETTQQDIGLDFSLFNSRIYGSFGLYEKVTDGLLLTIDMPGSSGYDRVAANVGKTSNKGWEAEVNGALVNKADLKWDLGIIFTRNRNVVLEIGGDAFSNPARRGSLDDAVVVEGEPLGTFYGFKVAGIFQTQEEIDALNAESPTGLYQLANTRPGDFKYIDINGDGVVNDLDRTTIGNANADFFGGIRNSLYYKGWNLSVQMNYSVGNQLIWRIDQSQTSFFGDRNYTTDVLDYWTPENPTARRPRAVIGDPNNNRRFSDFFVHDASYMKLSMVSLSYRLPKKLYNRWGVDMIQVYATGNNLFTITNYPGVDPEANSSPGSIFMGEDRSVYPPASIYTFGLKMNF